MTFPKWLAALGLLLACGTARGAPRERDVWYAFIEDGKRFGSLHVQVSRLPDGNYRFTRQVRLLLDLLGANQEQIDEQGEYVISPEYRPIALDIEVSRSSGKVQTAGRIREGQFEVKTSAAGIERSGRFDPAKGILFQPCLEDWLADLGRDSKVESITLLDEEGCEPRPARIRRLEGKDGDMAWSVDLGPLEGEQRLALDADGLLRERSSGDIGPTIVRCTAEEAGDLAYLKLDGRDLLTFPLDKDTGPPERLTSLTVEIRWRGIPFEQFRLTDDRQRVVEHSEAGGEHRAILQIDPAKPAPEDVRLPIAGDEFAPFLGESRFIRPHDAEIAETARRVIAGQGSALGTVKALSEWVSKNIEPAMITETLSGPEVLACRKGKCTEYATLFASLARSVGIPTRIALGERMGGGQWAGHMWNEVYVGRWIPVDASCNEVGSSFALLKFIDHETVEGTQPLRRTLPASLEIKVGEFSRQASPLAGKFQTGIEGHIYTNADLGCRIAAPNAEWSIEQKPQPGATVLRFKIPGQDNAQLHFVAFSLPAGVEPKTLIGLRLASYKSRLKGFEVLTDEAFTVNGANGWKIRFKHATAEGKGHQATEVVWRTASAGFLLGLDVEEPVPDGLDDGYDAILKTFEDLNKE